MSTETNSAFIRRFVDEAINRRNAAAIDQMVAEDFLEHVPLPGQGSGREGLKQAVAMLLHAFPDMRWTIEEQVAEGDKVVSRFAWTGTQQGEFMGIKPRGAKVSVWGVVIDVVRDGQFVESRIIMDSLGLLQQLGAIPLPSP